MFVHRSQRAVDKKLRPKTVKHQARVKPKSIRMNAFLRVLLAPRVKPLLPGLEIRILLLQVSQPHLPAFSSLSILKDGQSYSILTNFSEDILQAAIRVCQILNPPISHRNHEAVEKLQFTTIWHRPGPISLPETLMKPVIEKPRSPTIQHRPRPISLLETLVVKSILTNTSKVGAFLKPHLLHLAIKLNRKILWLRGCSASSEVY